MELLAKRIVMPPVGCARAQDGGHASLKACWESVEVLTWGDYFPPLSGDDVLRL